MKTLTLITALLFATTIGFAQSSNYTTDMQKGISILDTMKTQSGYEVAAKHFEKIASTETQWLPQYYAAYCNLITGVRGSQDAGTKDEIYGKAMKYITKADSISPNNSEIYTLRGYITFMQMSVYPQKRAMSMIPAASELIGKAIAIDKENPRAYLLKGTVLYYTPEMFGGSKDEAKTILTVAKDKFEKFTAKSLQPTWGKTRVEELLKEYK
ncbi:MAG: hypothetical protein EOP00_11335 [Pedobacter sp.]|nr:MAG: hypothetical protein EOP00_11335 [Pedobacter sp.]